MLIDAVSPASPVSIATLLTIAAGVLAVLDSGLRFRRPGGGAVLAILELVLGLLLVVSRLTLVQPYVSTTIPVLLLAIALAVVLVIQLLTKAARRNGLLWLTIFTLGVTIAAGAVVYLKVH